MKRLSILLFAALLPVAALAETRHLLLVVGAPGEERYAEDFANQARAWQDLAKRAEMESTVIGLGDPPHGGDRPRLEKALADLPDTGGDLWLVFIGHGSYDGRSAKFNLRGPDIDAAELARLLETFRRRLVLLNLFSASGPFLPALAGPDRIVITATRGGERNYSRFGSLLASSFDNPDADLDLDGSLSLLEAMLHASAATRAFYEDAQRVVPEHAQLDDNGDGRGTGAARFTGLRATAAAADGAAARDLHFLGGSGDPLPAEDRERRARLEAALDALRARKKDMKEEVYYTAVERLMREMATLYGYGR